MPNLNPSQIRSALLRITVIVFLTCGFLALQGFIKDAEAACACGALLNCSSSNCLHQETRSQVKDFIDDEFENHQGWIEDTWWKENLLPALRAMTEQLNAGQESVAAADAQTETSSMLRNTGLAIQEEQANIINAMRPSTGLCEAVTVNENAVDAEVARTGAESQVLQVATSNFSATIGTSNASASAAARYNEHRTQCLPQYRSQYPDVDCSDVNVYPSAMEALNQGGNFSADQLTATSTPVSDFVSSFAAPPPSSYTPDRFNQAAQLAWANRRALNASASLAARCYMKAVSGNISVEGTDWTDHQKAAMRRLGMNDEQIEAFPFNAQNYRRFLSMQSNSVQTDVNLIDTPENAQRINLVMQGSAMPILYDTLEQSLCSEMMVSLMLNTVSQPLRDAAEERATQVTLRTDENAAKTKFASSN